VRSLFTALAARHRRSSGALHAHDDVHDRRTLMGAPRSLRSALIPRL
jgi:hypothetical protein